MNNKLSAFSSRYQSARIRLLSAFAKVDGQHRSYTNHAATGKDEDLLTTDVLALGGQNQRIALVMVSGTHGVEGYCGSGAQVNFLNGYAKDRWSKDCAIVIVHAINPYGMANDRRVNEDNVDINRNFVDFDAELPANLAYDELHNDLVPINWEGKERNEADANLAAFEESNGQRAFQSAVVNGQYTHADGLFYGGSRPVWSNDTWRRIIEDHLGDFSRIALIDFHTGLGPFGYGEPIYIGAPGAAGQDRAIDWYGDDVTCPAEGSSVSTAIQGPLGTALETILPDTEVTPIALEFGTLPIDDVLGALRADNWLYLHGDKDSSLGKQIKQDIRAAFYPETDQWKLQVLERSEHIIACAMKGLMR